MRDNLLIAHTVPLRIACIDQQAKDIVAGLLAPLLNFGYEQFSNLAAQVVHTAEKLFLTRRKVSSHQDSNVQIAETINLLTWLQARQRLRSYGECELACLI